MGGSDSKDEPRQVWVIPGCLLPSSVYPSSHSMDRLLRQLVNSKSCVTNVYRWLWWRRLLSPGTQDWDVSMGLSPWATPSDPHLVAEESGA